MKTIKLILAATLTAALMASCGTAKNDKGNTTASPSPTAAAEQKTNTADTAKSGMDDIGDAAKDITDGAGSAVKGAVDGVENAVGDMTGNK